MTYRAAVALAEQLGVEAVIFPSHHGGFPGGEFGMSGDPEAFAATLRDALIRTTTTGSVLARYASA